MLMAGETLLGVCSGYTEPSIRCSIVNKSKKLQSSEQAVTPPVLITDTYRDSKHESWVRISKKDDAERINLAIVRLKDEDDFFDNKIFRFVEVLNGVGALDPGFYKLIKYGTADDTKIELIRDGDSHGLADLMLERYPETVRPAPDGDIEVSPRLVNMMVENGESDLLIFEAKMNLKPA